MRKAKIATGRFPKTALGSTGRIWEFPRKATGRYVNPSVATRGNSHIPPVDLAVDFFTGLIFQLN